jgi:hypothetical protein
MNFLNWNSRQDAKSDLQAATPTSPEEADRLIRMAETVIRVHATKGDASPISGSLIAELIFKAKVARQKHEEGLRLLKMARECFDERDGIFGKDETAPINIPSLKFYLSCTEEILRRTPGNSVKTLEEWGLQVGSK